MSFNFVVWGLNEAIQWLRYYTGWADKIHGQTIPAGIEDHSLGQRFSIFLDSRIKIFF
jgi:hypothetical protein